MNQFQQWAAVLAMVPFGAGSFTITDHPLIGWVFMAVGVALVAYAIAGRMREYRQDRHDIAVAQRRDRIAALEDSLGLDRTTWDDR